MNGASCINESAEAIRCPRSGTAGRPVDWMTVAALTTTPLPTRQKMALCPEAACGVIYFGDRGFQAEVAEVRVVPGYKESSDGLVCYCFGHRAPEIARDVGADGKSTIAESIHERVSKGDCACEVRNPSGKCCLADVKRVIEQARKELQL